MQHQLADRVSVNGGYYRRTFGNQTFTDDLRYDASSYDSFCINAAVGSLLPNGGGYQVCGVQDLKPAVFAQNLPANNLIRFSDDFGGETNMYQGFDVNLEGRFRNGAFLRAASAPRRAPSTTATCRGGPRRVPRLDDAADDGAGHRDLSRWHESCHRDYPYRPDVKLVGSYTLPCDIQLAARISSAAASRTAARVRASRRTWRLPSAQSAAALGARTWTGVASRTIQLIREGLIYGDTT